jgi:hypothetical protein
MYGGRQGLGRPELHIERMPRLPCLSLRPPCRGESAQMLGAGWLVAFSSLNLPPQMLSPPVPEVNPSQGGGQGQVGHGVLRPLRMAKSPPCTMAPGTMRWKGTVSRKGAKG